MQGQELAQGVDDAVGLPRQSKGDKEEDDVVGDVGAEAFPAKQRGDGGLHGNRTGARQSVESADSKVCHGGKDNAEELAAVVADIAHGLAGDGHCHHG